MEKAKEIDNHADTIIAQTDIIEQQNPSNEILIPTLQIVNEANNIKSNSETIQQASKELSKSDRANLEKIAKLEHTIKKLEEQKYGLISKWLAAVAILSLIFSVFSIFILKSPKASIAGGVLFCMTLAAQWLLNYAVIIGLVSIVALVVGIIIMYRKERLGLTQVVATVEQIKGNVPNFKEVANSIQNKSTNKLVHKIKKYLAS